MNIQKITGKVIDQFAKSTNELPSYFGDYINYYSDDNKKVNGSFIAKKYKAILDLIKETKASVNIQTNEILITYNNGNVKICRDVFTDSFLLPSLQNLQS